MIIVIPIASDFLPGVRMSYCINNSLSNDLNQSITQKNQVIELQITKPSGSD